MGWDSVALGGEGGVLYKHRKNSLKMKTYNIGMDPLFFGMIFVKQNEYRLHMHYISSMSKRSYEVNQSAYPSPGGQFRDDLFSLYVVQN